MSQDPEEPPIVFRHATPEEFCAAYNRAVAEGTELGTTTRRRFDRPAGMTNDLAGVGRRPGSARPGRSAETPARARTGPAGRAALVIGRLRAVRGRAGRVLCGQRPETHAPL